MMQSNDMELDNCLEKVQKFLIHFKAAPMVLLISLSIAVLSYVVRRPKLKLIANTHAYAYYYALLYMQKDVCVYPKCELEFTV